MAAGPGPGSHWVSINIVIGKQQDTGAIASRQEELVYPIRGPGEISRTNQRPGMRDGDRPSSQQGSTRSN